MTVVNTALVVHINALTVHNNENPVILDKMAVPDPKTPVHDNPLSVLRKTPPCQNKKLRFHPNKLQVRWEKLVFRLGGFRFLGVFLLFNRFESSADPVKRGGLSLEPCLGGGPV